MLIMLLPSLLMNGASRPRESLSQSDLQRRVQLGQLSQGRLNTAIIIFIIIIIIIIVVVVVVVVGGGGGGGGVVVVVLDQPVQENRCHNLIFKGAPESS